LENRRADVEESTAADGQQVDRDRHDHRGAQFDRACLLDRDWSRSKQAPSSR